MSNAQSAGSAKPKFKPGDKVVRVNQNNGPNAAKVGQVATVVGLSNAMVHVAYEGCYKNGERSPFPECEGWYVENVALYVDPKGPIEWADHGISACYGYVDDFAFASISKLSTSSYTLATQLPYETRTHVGTFRTIEAAKKYAEDEANDLKILGKFKGGLR